MNGGSRHRDELDGITTVERQRQDVLVADDRAYARRLHVNERRGSLNGDLFEGANHQHRIDHV